MHRTYPRERRTLLLGLLTLLLSLMTPMLALEPASAQGNPPNCEPGSVVSNDGTTCVPDPNTQQQLECPEGTVPDQAGTGCVPDPNLPPLECDPGFIPDQAGTSCVPDPNQQPTCGEGEMLDPVTNGCVPDPNAPLACDEGMVPDQSGTTCVPDPNRQIAASTIDLNLTTRQCDSATEITIADVDLAWLSANCGAPAIPFAMTHTAPDGTATPANVSGMWGLGTQSIGLHTFSQTLPEGYALQVYCNFRFDTGAETGYQARAVDAEAGYLQLDILDPVEAVSCDWYNVQATVGEYVPPVVGNVHLTKSNCPLFATLDTSTSTYQDWASTCTEPGGGVLFEVRTLNGAIPLASGETDASGKLILDVQAPQIILTEEKIPPGYTHAEAFCAYRLPNYQPADFIIEGTTTYYELYKTSILDCHWFNIPADPNTLGTIHLTKHTCAENIEGFNPAAATYEDFLANCPDTTEGIQFMLIEPDDEGPGDTLDTDANGEVTFPNLTPGLQYTVMESRLEFVTAYAFCAYGTNQAPGTTYDPVEVSASKAIRYTLDGGYLLDCHWFNIAGEAPPALPEIEIAKYNCPAGTAPTDPLSWDQVTPLAADCAPTPGINVPFEVRDGTGATVDSGQTDAQRGTLEFTELAPGAYTVHETFPGGYAYAVAFCTHFAPGSATDLQPVQYDATGAISTTLANNEWLRCDIFNFMGDGPQASSVESSSITLHKRVCQPGTDPALGFEDLLDACGGTASGIQFTLALPDGTTRQETSGADGLVMWDELSDGTYPLSERPIAANSPPLAWCAYTVSEGTEIPEPDRQYNQYPVASWSTQVEIAGHPAALDCYWLNFLPAGGTVSVYSFDCPDEPTGLQTIVEWGMYCGTPRDGHAFTLTDSTGTSQTSPTANGFATWQGVPAGPISLTGEILPGFADPVVWCGWYQLVSDDEEQEASAPLLMSLVNGAVEDTLPSDDTVYSCAWFNIPALDVDTTTVIVRKHVCPEGATPEATWESYDAVCTERVEGVEFTLDTALNSPTKATNAIGSVEWSLDVPVGPFTLTETVPQGYGEPVWWCLSEFGAGFDPIRTGVSIEILNEQGGEYYCEVFNVHGEAEYGEMHFTKYTCPTGFEAPQPPLSAGSETEFQSECTTPGAGVTFELADGAGVPLDTATTDQNGAASFDEVPAGDFWLKELIPAEYGYAVAFCDYVTPGGDVPQDPFTLDSNVARPGNMEAGATLTCRVYNVPPDPENGWITVHKRQCPPGTTATDFAVLAESCTEPHNGIGFTLSGPGGSQSAATAGGRVDWTNLDQGIYTVTETTALPGYETPIVFCGIVLQDGAPIDPGSVEWLSQTVTDRSIQVTLDNFPKRIDCHWYNIPSDYGEITIYKWLCPEGYDLHAWGADPTVDCATPQNGVTFTLDQPEDTDLQTTTGDAIPGAVYFGGLDPGSYTIVETVPADIDAVFVLDCTGTSIPKVHQYPLSWGPKLDINVAAGDSIVCHWYNVPGTDAGWLTVTKYTCTTTTFVDKVHCTIYEGGQAFELLGMPGETLIGTGTTGADGTSTWKGLDPGTYSINEPGMVPCKMTATNVDGKGNARVVAGEGTTIHVYNCTSTPGKVPPGKVPGKYPNTGVPPAGADAFLPANLPAMQDDEATPPSGTPSPEEEAFYAVDCISGTVPEGTPVPSTPAPDATMPPIEAEPTEPPLDADTTPTPPATPEVAAGECQRGAIPQRLVIDAIGVDAEFEYLEIVDGVMEQPAGPELVAWYRDTARLGETNNVVVAGHLNWWNVPEGVFYRLQDLEAGDRIAVTGDDGQVYLYEVQTVSQESNLEEPGLEVIGPTEEPTLTLITCGGAWNSEIAEYDARTVVRAVQVEVQPAEAG